MSGLAVSIDGTGIGAAIDEAPFGRTQQLVVVLCALVALLEGLDTQAIAFVAPVLASAWGLTVASFGDVFGAGLAGLTVGALLLSPLADWAGRKPVIVASICLFGLMSLATAFVTSTAALILLRFLTGVGIGGSMPNIIALTAEYAPARLRATSVSIMFCGFPMGAVLGGVVGAPIITLFGWQSVFLFGGVLPLLLVPILLLFLPESLRFLLARAHLRFRGETILREVLGTLRAAAVDVNTELADTHPASPLKALFVEGRTVRTLLLWVTCFITLMMMYFMVNWLPTLLKQAGIPLEKAIISTAVLNLGGVTGAFVLARMIDKRRSGSVLAFVYVVAAACTYAIGHMTRMPYALLMATVFVVGFCVIGAQMSLNVLAANLYPTSARATGIGWALGFGRIGSIIGPMAGGLLIGYGLDVSRLLAVSAIPGFVAAATVWLLSASSPTQPTEAQATAT